jgi:tetratricopeptide (TPR) repeat protein
MALSPNSIHGFSHCLKFLLLVLVGGLAVLCRNAFASEPSVGMHQPQVATEREIEQLAPALLPWQSIWLRARNAARQDDFSGAVALYNELLSIKPNLEEASWELARIRLARQEQEKAAVLLEWLLETDGDRVVYLNGLASILQGKAYFSRAVELYARGLQNEPDNLEALKGIVQSLVKLRRKKEALPYLEKLHRLKPADLQIHRDLAIISYELKEFERARSHLAELADGAGADISLLEVTARTHEQLGLENLAIPYRMRILALDSDHQESHDRLAQFYQRSGRAEEALFHFQALLVKNPANSSLLHAIGRLLENSGRFAEALPFFERYLHLRPEDRKVLDTVVNLHAALGEKAETLASLERLLAVDSFPEPGKLKLAAQLYHEAGRVDKAIPLYRRVLAASPEDREVIAALAAALSETGKANSALSMWRHLTELEPERLEAYRAMAEILASQQRYGELLEVLEKIHALDGSDEQVVLALAGVYLERGEVEIGRFFLEKVDENTPFQAPYLEMRGNYFEMVSKPNHALLTFAKLLELQPGRESIRLKIIRLAGELGKLSLLRQHLAVIEQSRIDFRTELIIAEALVNCFVYDEALDRYQRLLQDGRLSAGSERQEVLLAMAALYRQAGLPYEAEQALRMIFLHDREMFAALVELFELTLAAALFEEAEIWLGQLRKADYPEQRLLTARLLSAKGEHRTAIKIGTRLLAERDRTNSETRIDRQQRPPDLFLGQLLLTAGLLTEAERHLLAAAGEKHPAYELERLILLQQIALGKGDGREVEKRQAEAMAFATRDLDSLLHLASLYREAGLIKPARQIARQAVAIAPDSLRASFLLIAAQQAAGETEPALAAVRRVLASHPEHARGLAWEIELLFQAGKFQEAEIRSEAIPPDNPYYAKQQLLKGRALWRQNRWQESLAVYETFLAAPVAEVFEEKSAAQAVYYLPEISRTSIWQLLSYREIEASAFIDRAMTAAHVADNSSQRQREVNSIAIPLYADYRWQERFAGELAARRSVSRREYYLAIRQFEALLKTYREEECLMFDLAGLYSRQGFPGEEAIIYRTIASGNPYFPGLGEAVERNQLKRRPFLRFGFDRFSEKGRSGQKAIRQEQGTVGGWFSPALQQEIDIAAYRIRYQSTEDDRELWARRAFLSYRTDFNNFSFKMGGGVEDQGGDQPSTGLLAGEVTGRIGDKWRSYLSASRDVTTDTMASLTRNIVRHDIRTGLGIDILPHLMIGGDYSLTDFSDSNTTIGHDLWASYILLPEPTFLKLSYTYEFRDSRRGARSGIPLADGFAVDDHPYWAPVNYWINQVGIHFKHQLSEERFDRSMPRYYILEYSVGHDSDGKAVQYFKGGFFLEWTQRVLMEAVAEITSSEPYRQSVFSLSTSYRW